MVGISARPGLAEEVGELGSRVPRPREDGESDRGGVVAESDDELVAEIRRGEQVMRDALFGQLLRIAEAERRGLHGTSGARSVQAWLREMLNLAAGEARRRVQVAREVTERVGLGGEQLPPALPETAGAMRNGEITLAHAGTIVDGVAAMPPGVDATERHAADALLARQARELPPHELRSAGEHLRYLLDQDGALRTEEYQVEHRELRIATGRDGMTVLNGRLDRESGAELRAALQPLAAPRREADGVPDTRSPAKRNADAFVDLLERKHGDARAQVRVTIDYDQLTEGLVADGACEERNPQPDVFGRAPRTGGTVDNTEQPITAAAARRLACDAEVLPLVLGGDGQPLDVGRSERTAPAHIRAALSARDGSCAFPDCDRPPGTSQAHHVRHWADGGATALHNMVMLCGHHHRLIHRQRWEVTMDDGWPAFLPPVWVDPARRPRVRARTRHQRTREPPG